MYRFIFWLHGLRWGKIKVSEKEDECPFCGAPPAVDPFVEKTSKEGYANIGFVVCCKEMGEAILRIKNRVSEYVDRRHGQTGS